MNRRVVDRTLLDHRRAGEYTEPMQLGGFSVEFERETDGRWIAEAPDLPGAMVYGVTKEDAGLALADLIIRILRDQLRSAQNEAEAYALGENL